MIVCPGNATAAAYEAHEREKKKLEGVIDKQTKIIEQIKKLIEWWEDDNRCPKCGTESDNLMVCRNCHGLCNEFEYMIQIKAIINA